MSQVDDALHTESEDRPTDELATGRAVRRRIAQRAPAHHDQQHRQQVAAQPDHGRGADPDPLAQQPGDGRPERCGDDHREAEQPQPDTVATQRGIGLVGISDTAGKPAEAACSAVPDARQQPPHRIGRGRRVLRPAWLLGRGFL
ncbi:hypothetical protein SDC9_96050 [bioreactor metagenome]|uniref:Uncharacterized protein n=1 Tax=bioreactor metagenome TaxID=1076179 RepID=A0A645AAK1_9ZZZZ